MEGISYDTSATQQSSRSGSLDLFKDNILSYPCIDKRLRIGTLVEEDTLTQQLKQFMNSIHNVKTFVDYILKLKDIKFTSQDPSGFIGLRIGTLVEEDTLTQQLKQFMNSIHNVKTFSFRFFNKPEHQISFESFLNEVINNYIQTTGSSSCSKSVYDILKSQVTICFGWILFYNEISSFGYNPEYPLYISLTFPVVELTDDISEEIKSSISNFIPIKNFSCLQSVCIILGQHYIIDQLPISFFHELYKSNSPGNNNNSKTNTFKSRISLKPSLPFNLKEVNKQLNIPLPITNTNDIIPIKNLLWKHYYFGNRLPDSFIKIPINRYNQSLSRNSNIVNSYFNNSHIYPRSRFNRSFFLSSRCLWNTLTPISFFFTTIFNQFLSSNLQKLNMTIIIIPIFFKSSTNYISRQYKESNKGGYGPTDIPPSPINSYTNNTIKIESATNFTFKEQDIYKCFWSPNDLEPRGIVTLLFKGKSRILIIQVYLPSDKKSSRIYQTQIRKLIIEETKKNTNIIIMGDFNTVVLPHLDRLSRGKDKVSTLFHKLEILLFDFFEDWAFTDLQATWQGDKYHITGSDHSILSCEIFSDSIFNLQSNATLRRKGSQTVFNYKSMTIEEWRNFASILDHKLQTHNILEHIKQELSHTSNNNSSDNVDNTNLFHFKISDIWNQIESYFIQAANKHISTKQVKRSTAVNNLHLDRSLTFKTWKSLISVISLISKSNTPPSSITSLNHSTIISKWLLLAKEFSKSLKVKLKLEETAKTCRFIKETIKSKCSDLFFNQRHMINSLTNYTYRTITLDRLLIKNDEDNSTHITTDPKEVQSYTMSYYELAFKKRDVNFNRLDKSWKCQYTPRDYINSDCYKNLGDTPTKEELREALSSLLNGKACSISGISYEMLKKQLETQYNLSNTKTHTRPIILLETGPNFAGLPGESIHKPIHLLNNIFEDAHEKHKELKLCIITDYRLTNEIIAGDKIDQGEIISPLLWRIFYNPLLCKINNNNNDTTWIASSKNDFQAILNDAT
ncbi:hypothetical protein Glove_682g5 [Diversispora epigaea]|uniref:Endonuclease/exonuclease/phosphatase domain-containing protein n=1 Tax=Diversispora epigaea TaxID=1348612 RepID=A0A397G7F1_9GLOM|nr:hypothetical protein Glove_682g5 [Diversispora epigaea]